MKNKGNFKEALEDYEDCLKEIENKFDQVFENSPSDTVLNQDNALIPNLLFSLSRLHFKTGNYVFIFDFLKLIFQQNKKEEAIKVCKNGLKLCENDYAFLCLLCVVERKSKKEDYLIQLKKLFNSENKIPFFFVKKFLAGDYKPTLKNSKYLNLKRDTSNLRSRFLFFLF